MGSRSDWITRLGLVFGAGILLTILAPYDTGGLPVWGRALYWIGLVAIGLVSGELVAAGINRAMPDSTPSFVMWLLISLAVSVPVTGAVVVIQATTGANVSWSALPALYFLVWVISAAITAVGVLAGQGQGEAGAGGDPAVGAALRDKLPPKLRGAELWALEAEDHYLRVRTSAGDALILMRLSDAVAAAEALPGLRVHRSWWVAEAGVDAARRAPGGRAEITLKDGATAPVSRANAPKLREAGWL